MAAVSGNDEVLYKNKAIHYTDNGEVFGLFGH